VADGLRWGISCVAAGLPQLEVHHADAVSTVARRQGGDALSRFLVIEYADQGIGQVAKG
jgi:hypothetical protein